MKKLDYSSPFHPENTQRVRYSFICNIILYGENLYNVRARTQENLTKLVNI